MTNPVSTSKPPPQASSFPSWSSLIKKLFDYRTWDPMTQAMVASVLFFLVEVGVFSFWHISTKALAYALSVPATAFAAAFLRRLRLHWSTIAALMGILFMYGTYIGYTSHNERNFDVKAQITYIEYLVEHLRPPPDNHCFICHHPPLYYSTGAVAYALTKWSGAAPPLRGVQMVSLISTFAFVMACTQITRRITTKQWVVTAATLLCGLWPYTIIFSARIHNDALSMTMMIWAVYYCVVWYQSETRRSLILASVFCVLSVLTKTNGLVAVAILFSTIGFRALYKPDRMAFLRTVAPVLFALVLGLGAYMTNRGSAAEKKEDKKESKDKKNDGKDEDENAIDPGGEAPPEDEEDLAMGERLMGSAFRIGKRSWMQNEPYNYLYLDIQNFLQEPYVLARKDGYGRQLYLSHLLKSSLFSTHNERADAETSYRFNKRLAQVEAFLLLCLLAYVTIFLAQSKKADFRRNFPLIIAFLGFFGAGAAFRFIVPHSHHSDFRHIFPILVPFCIAFALGLAHYRRKDSVMEYVGWVLMVLFLGNSVLYFTPKYTIIQKISPVEFIEKNQSDVSKKVKAGAKWNEPEHIIVEGTEALKVKLDGKPDVARVEISADHNDKWQLSVVGATETRTVEFGPHPDNKAGMAIYLEQIEPPVKEVKHLTIRPLNGDRAYSIGHVVVNEGIIDSKTLPNKKADDKKADDKKADDKKADDKKADDKKADDKKADDKAPEGKPNGDASPK